MNTNQKYARTDVNYHGYGIDVESLSNVTDAANIFTLLMQAPKTEALAKQYLDGNAGEEVNDNELLDLLLLYISDESSSDGGLAGLAYIVLHALEELSGADFAWMDMQKDFPYSQDIRVFLQPKYAWEQTEADKNMTEEKLFQLYKKVQNILTLGNNEFQVKDSWGLDYFRF